MRAGWLNGTYQKHGRGGPSLRALPEIHPGRIATIPAFVRPSESARAAFALMVAENDIRAGLSP